MALAPLLGRMGTIGVYGQECPLAIMLCEMPSLSAVEEKMQAIIARQRGRSFGAMPTGKSKKRSGDRTDSISILRSEKRIRCQKHQSSFH